MLLLGYEEGCFFGGGNDEGFSFGGGSDELVMTMGERRREVNLRGGERVGRRERAEEKRRIRVFLRLYFTLFPLTRLRSLT